MPPRPSSSQSDGGSGGSSGGPVSARLSHSPMPPGPGGYGPPGQQSPHPGSYKGMVAGPGGPPQNSPQMPLYQHQPGQYPVQAGGYPPRPPGNVSANYYFRGSKILENLSMVKRVKVRVCIMESFLLNEIESYQTPVNSTSVHNTLEALIVANCTFIRL